MKKEKAIISGSFDPITKGHEWLILESLKQFSEIVLVIGNNSNKTSFFDINTKIKLIESFIINSGLEKKVKIAYSDKLYLVDFAEELSINHIIRGIRDSEDLNYENKIVEVNKIINPNIETHFISCPPEYQIISSSLVKSLIGFLGWERVIRKFVSDAVYSEFQKRLYSNHVKNLLHEFFDINLNDESPYSREISLQPENKLKLDEENIFLSILEKYAEPHRYYHNLQHLSDLYLKLNTWKVNSNEKKILVMAILFHDIIYDPKKFDNEELSNELFLKYFSQWSDCNRVSKLILATKDHSIHKIGEDKLLDIFLDLDLSILGSSSLEYKNYEKNIREEFNFVPDNIFDIKRKEIMKKLNIPYRTTEAQLLWGKNRKTNLSIYED